MPAHQIAGKLRQIEASRLPAIVDYRRHGRSNDHGVASFAGGSLYQSTFIVPCGIAPCSAAVRRNGCNPVDDYLASFHSPPTEEVLDRCLHHDLRHYVAKLLFMEDRVSMAVSLESRVPLLDYRIAELVASVPPEQKVRGRIPKFLLREAAKRWLPDEVLERRDKVGFPIPTQQWFGNELARDLQQVLGSAASRKRGIFRESVFDDRNFWITNGWEALNLELWHRIFIDRDIEPGVPLGEVE